MIRKHKTFSFHYSTSTSFSGLFFSPGNLLTATLQVACTDHRCTRRLNSAGVLVRRLAAGGWVRLCEECYCMPRMPNAYPLLVRVLVSITAKPEHNPLIPGMTHAQRFEKKKNRDLSAQIIQESRETCAEWLCVWNDVFAVFRRVSAGNPNPPEIRPARNSTCTTPNPSIQGFVQLVLLSQTRVSVHA